MTWKQIDQKTRSQPAAGKYNDWKEQIAEDCHFQCVYCAIPESSFGGIDHYHIDHFRPKSRPAFFHLQNSIQNLFYACPICNRFKSNDWPGEPDPQQPTYQDPGEIDFSSLFNVDPETLTISGKNVSANYMVLRLYLNRPQLVYERREAALRAKEKSVIAEIKALLKAVGPEPELFEKALELIDKCREHLHKKETVRPYTLNETKKQSI
jgi:hypothetical protein